MAGVTRLVLRRKFADGSLTSLRALVFYISLLKAFALLLNKKTSPLAVKNTGASVFFYPRARDRGRSFSPFLSLKQKNRLSTAFFMAGVTRLELATSCVTGRRSNQLSYTPIGFVYSYSEQIFYLQELFLFFLVFFYLFSLYN